MPLQLTSAYWALSLLCEGKRWDAANAAPQHCRITPKMYTKRSGNMPAHPSINAVSKAA